VPPSIYVLEQKKKDIVGAFHDNELTALLSSNTTGEKLRLKLTSLVGGNRLRAVKAGYPTV
jgi:hypothetical protein